MKTKIHKLLSNARIALQKGQLELSSQLLLEILQTEPDNFLAKELLAYVCGSQGDQDQARQLLKEVVADANAPLSALYEYGSILLNINPRDAVLPLERAFRIAPNSFEVLHDLATAYACVGLKQEAVEKFSVAARINPNSSELFYNLGCLHDDLHNPIKANACYQKAMEIDSLFAKPRINLALNLNQVGRFEESIVLLQEALAIEPKADFIFGYLLHARMQIGLWRDFEKDLLKVLDGIQTGQRIIHPFHLLSLVDDPVLLRRGAEIYAASRDQVTSSLGKLDLKQGKKIKVGYFSADFKNHPVTHLTAELFELHDKTAFEIYAFSSGLKDEDEQRRRLKKAFHEFIDISNLSDDEVVSLARSKGIDIAVDLGGYTENARIGVFERRVAPIQVSYLGYLGTLGSIHMDYILADHEVIPIEHQQYFAEKIAYLPACYQINDRKRSISEKQFARAEFGLRDESFVFCCFNHSYKITPEVFSSWCNILQRVEGSILWLYESNSIIAKNLREEAKRRGIGPERLVFSSALPGPEYLARYRLADLFLDTFPYNAGTTASDALMVGLPVLTRSGNSFPSRMAGSILKAIGAPELVTHTIAEYESLAVELAKNSSKLKSIRQKINTNKKLAPLFDSPKTTKNIERAYQEMYKRYLNGAALENIDSAD